MARIVVGLDDLTFGEGLQRALEAEGHDVRWVRDGLAACEESLSSPPDMVFLSGSLPVFDGYEACTRLRQDPALSPTLPVVLVSDAPPNPRRVEAAGFSDVLRTSEGSAVLREMLAKHLGPLANPRA